jgi:NADPH:quinone reductase-like Zn-dependent oxidoreductase
LAQLTSPDAVATVLDKDGGGLTRRMIPMATMMAVRFHKYGGPAVLHLEQIERPDPGPGQILVRVHAASVNPVDWKLRQGDLKAMLDVPFPSTAGEDLAGEVAAVGEGVASFQPGDAVYAMMPIVPTGAYAEYAVLDAAAVGRKPATLDFTTAAAVPMGALTAWQGIVGQGGLQAGTKLFVHAAGGNVGGMAVQISHALGAHVTAAASAGSRALVEGWGADRFVGYGAGRFEDAVDGMDVVFDTLGGEMQARSWGVLKPGGILVSTVGVADPGQAEAHGVRAVGFGAVPDGAQLGRIAEMVDAGQIRPNIGAVLPLAEAAEAQEMNRTGRVKGKVVLRVV